MHGALASLCTYLAMALSITLKCNPQTSPSSRTHPSPSAIGAVAFTLTVIACSVIAARNLATLRSESGKGGGVSGLHRRLNYTLKNSWPLPWLHHWPPRRW